MVHATINLGDLVRSLDRLANDLRGVNWQPVLKASGLVLRSSTLENFANAASPDGVPWKPLARPRANSKGGDKPLRDKGILAASLASYGRGHVEEMKSTPAGATLHWGTAIEYSGIHNYGGTIHKGELSRYKPWVFTAPDGRKIFTRKIKAHSITIPARPFIGIKPDDVDQIAAIVADFLTKRLSGG